MNIILYYKNENDYVGVLPEILEFIKLRMPGESNDKENVLKAGNPEDVIKLLSKHSVQAIIFWDFILISHVGLINYINDNYPLVKIIIYSEPTIKEAIEIIKNVNLSIFEKNIENLKKVKEILHVGRNPGSDL